MDETITIAHSYFQPLIPELPEIETFRREVTMENIRPIQISFDLATFKLTFTLNEKEAIFGVKAKDSK